MEVELFPAFSKATVPNFNSACLSNSFNIENLILRAKSDRIEHSVKIYGGLKMIVFRFALCAKRSALCGSPKQGHLGPDSLLSSQKILCANAVTWVKYTGPRYSKDCRLQIFFAS